VDKKTVLEQIRQEASKDRLKRKDPRFLRTLGFLAAKNYLHTNIAQIAMRPTAKINVVDAVWAGENVEPRILEVLPAALLKFPGNFLLRNQLPQRLSEIVECIRRGDEDGPDYKGIEYRKMKDWAELRLPDRRTKPMRELKVAKEFRLSPAAIARLEKAAAALNITSTEVLELAISKLRI
jgi:hypothetical protein